MRARGPHRAPLGDRFLTSDRRPRLPGGRRPLAAGLVAVLALAILAAMAGCDDDPAVPRTGRQWITSLEPQYTNRSVWGDKREVRLTAAYAWGGERR